MDSKELTDFCILIDAKLGDSRLTQYKEHVKIFVDELMIKDETLNALVAQRYPAKPSSGIEYTDNPIRVGKPVGKDNRNPPVSVTIGGKFRRSKSLKNKTKRRTK